MKSSSFFSPEWFTVCLGGVAIRFRELLLHLIFKIPIRHGLEISLQCSARNHP